MRLASWEAAAEPGQQQDSASGEGATSEAQLLQRFVLSSLDCTSSSSGTLGASARDELAALVAASGREHRLQQRMQLQLALPADAVLAAVAESSSCPAFSAWQAPADEAALGAAPTGRSLPPLLRLLGQAAVPEEQRAALLLAAAKAALAGGNASCTRRLLAQAFEGLTASAGSAQAEGHLLLRLLELRTAMAADGDAGGGNAAWQLLLATRDSPGARWAVPAAAQLALQQLQQPGQAPGLTAAEASGLGEAARLPPLSGGSRSIAELEGHVLTHGSLAAQYAVLKTAVAAAPDCAQQWWQWGAWLRQLAAQLLQGAAAQAAPAAAFAASCHALALAGSSTAAGASGDYSTLPMLLAVLQPLQHDAGAALPADAAAQLAAVPVAAWLPLAPQLVSQLCSGGGFGSGSDGSEAGRQQLLGLLLRIGCAAPCEVLLPALVAAQQSSGAAVPGRQLLSQLLQELQQRHPSLAQQLRVLAAEAARLAVLPEEHWHAVLQEAAATAARPLQAQQRQQAAAAAQGPAVEDAQEGGTGLGDASSGRGNYTAMLPVLLALQQQLQAAEAAAPETPHERRFQEQHMPRLHWLLQQLIETASGVVTAAASEASAAPPGKQRHQLVALLRAAAAEMGAALRSKQLALADVAPALAQLADSGIAIPGAAVGATPAPTLAGVGVEVAVLPTKTRPKRLTFTGSDGERRTFLLKVGCCESEAWAARMPPAIALLTAPLF